MRSLAIPVRCPSLKFRWCCSIAEYMSRNSTSVPSWKCERRDLLGQQSSLEVKVKDRGRGVYIDSSPSRHGPDFHWPQSQITIDGPDFHLWQSQNCLLGWHFGIAGPWTWTLDPEMLDPGPGFRPKNTQNLLLFIHGSSKFCVFLGQDFQKSRSRVYIDSSGILESLDPGPGLWTQRCWTLDRDFGPKTHKICCYFYMDMDAANFMTEIPKNIGKG